MCLSEGQLIFFLIVMPLLLLAAGALGLVWLAVALSKRAHVEDERQEPDQNLAAEVSHTHPPAFPA
jgi:hypothetical protein